MFSRRSMLGRVAAWAAVVVLPAGMAGGPAGADPAGEEAAKAPAGAAKAPAPAPKPAPPAVRLEFCESLDSRSARKGDRVRLKVVEDVTVDGKVRFRKDAEASGLVERVNEPGRFGKNAELRLRLDWVKDVNGVQVPLTSYRSGRRFDPAAGGASLGGAVFLGPIGLLGGAFIKGGHITIKQGTRIQARALLPDPAR